MQGQTFSADHDFRLAVNLRPDYLKALYPYRSRVKQMAAQLQQLGQKAPPSPLLDTESWFLTQVEQLQTEQKVSYRTFWHYFKMTADTAKQLQDGQFLDALLGFIQEKDDFDLETFNQELQADANEFIEEELTDLFREVFSSMKAEEAPKKQKSKPSRKSAAAKTTPKANVPLIDVVAAFFRSQDWPVHAAPDGSYLGILFQGEQGQWNGYAQTDEATQRFFFYSLLPSKVPEAQRDAMAILLMRLNDGLSIGNFELNFEDGQIRYKTSIDVEGSQLTPALVQQMVYSNLLTVDQHFTTISQAIYGPAR